MSGRVCSGYEILGELPLFLPREGGGLPLLAEEEPLAEPGGATLIGCVPRPELRLRLPGLGTPDAYDVGVRRDVEKGFGPTDGSRVIADDPDWLHRPMRGGSRGSGEFAVVALIRLRRTVSSLLFDRIEPTSMLASFWVVSFHAVRLGRIVAGITRVDPWRARGAHTSLGPFRLVRDSGEPAELVIGLPRKPRTKDGLAWSEPGHRGVGQSPGRGSHGESERAA